MFDRKKQVFWVSGIMDEENYKKITIPTLKKLEKFLNKKVKIEHYGDGVKYVTYIFIVNVGDKTLHKEDIAFLKKEDTLFLQIVVPYNLLEDVNLQKEVLQTLALTIMQKSNHLSKLKISNFNHQLFIKDLQKLFIEKDWLLPQTVS